MGHMLAAGTAQVQTVVRMQWLPQSKALSCPNLRLQLLEQLRISTASPQSYAHSHCDSKAAGRVADVPHMCRLQAVTACRWMSASEHAVLLPAVPRTVLLWVLQASLDYRTADQPIAHGYRYQLLHACGGSSCTHVTPGQCCVRAPPCKLKFATTLLPALLCLLYCQEAVLSAAAGQRLGCKSHLARACKSLHVGNPQTDLLQLMLLWQQLH